MKIKFFEIINLDNLQNIFQEALLHRQSKERRIAVSEGINYRPPSYPKCIHSRSGIKCGARTVPLSKYCLERECLLYIIYMTIMMTVCGYKLV